jgi:hypothetical protein
MHRAKKHPKLSADERAFLNRLDCLNEEEIKQLTTREIFAYFKIIDKVDPFLLMRARARATVRVWKKRPELQAHSRIRVRNACGLPAATGGRVMTQPPSPLTMLLAANS